MLFLASLRKKKIKIADGRIVWHPSRPSGLATETHPLGQFTHYNRRIQLNRRLEFLFIIKDVPRIFEELPLSFYLPRKANKQTKTGKYRSFGGWQSLCVYQKQFNEKKKSIIIVILLQRALTDLLDSSPPFWSTTLSWSLWCDVSFDCVLNHLVKLSGSPYADGLLCVSQLVTSDLSEYVLTIMAYSEIVQILPPEWQIFHNLGFLFLSKNIPCVKETSKYNEKWHFHICVL